MSQSAKHFKSAYKNYLHLNSLYIPYQYNTATHHINTVTVTQQHTTVTTYKPALQIKHSTVQEAPGFDPQGKSAGGRGSHYPIKYGYIVE